MSAPLARRQRRKGPPVLALMVVVAGLAWGAWTTRAILDLRRAPAPFVKVQLGGLVADYVRAQARSATPPDQMGAQTQAFMKLLDAALAREAHAGRVVLVSEAVAGGSVPDITESVRREVYAKMPAPRTAVDGGTEARMRDWLIRDGGSDGAGH
ncbi:MAG: hypothetical protein ABT10_24415 [Novosphingobium sp. SCN 63-17]|nr:MAG: hypothetical protein ABT10_24415 [Novosphingobium sp. SCN 63-17]